MRTYPAVLLGVMLTLCLVTPIADAAHASSVYAQLGSDVTVSSDMVLLQETVSVPTSGYVLVVANGRYFPAGGSRAQVEIWVDSYGVQQLQSPSSVSQRTTMAGYLSADAPLSPGAHTVKVYAQADGDFKHVSAHKELLLVYFD